MERQLDVGESRTRTPFTMMKQSDKVTIPVHLPMADRDREKWVVEQGRELATAFAVKFMKGRAEHGQDLGHVSTAILLDEMEREALDQLAYVREMKRRFL